MASPTGPTDRFKNLTSNNLLRLEHGSSLTPSDVWDFPGASQYLSSGATSSRRPMHYRIQITQDQVRYYKDRLLGFEPEGVQAVREGEARMQKEQGSVPQQDDFYVLATLANTCHFATR